MSESTKAWTSLLSMRSRLTQVPTLRKRRSSRVFRGRGVSRVMDIAALDLLVAPYPLLWGRAAAKHEAVSQRAELLPQSPRILDQISITQKHPPPARLMPSLIPTEVSLARLLHSLEGTVLRILLRAAYIQTTLDCHQGSMVGLYGLFVPHRF